MATRRMLLKSLTVLGLSMAISTGNLSGIKKSLASDDQLSWRHFPAGENGFFRAPVLVTGATEAVLIDSSFTLSDGRAIAEVIQQSGKQLTTVYISQSDPDYYFGLGAIQAAFPDARVIAAPATIDAIKGNVEKKISTWSPQLQENGPQSVDEIVMPEAFDGQTLQVDGQDIQIVNVEGLPNRRYLWAPSLEAVFGGVLVFSDLHVWTADTPTAEQRAAWVQALDEMAARSPRVVIPGHMQPDAAIDASAIQYTREYLLAFEEELAKANNSDELIEAMTRRYPNAKLSVALQIGAKVAMGEMDWG